MDKNAVLWPIISTFKLCGIWPVRVRWSKGGRSDSDAVEVGQCKWRLVFSGVLLVVTVLHSVWAPTMLVRLERSIIVEFAKANKIPRNATAENDRQLFANKQTTVVKMVHPLLSCVTSLTTRSLSVSLLPRRMPDLVRKMSRIEDVLSVPATVRRSDAIALLSFFAGFIAFNIPLASYHLWQLSFFHTGWGDAWEAFSIFNIFAASSLEFQFVTLCYVVRSRLAYVNRRLGEFAEEALDGCPGYAGYWEKVFQVRLKSRPREDVIRSLRIAHVLLRDVMDDLNAIYQVHLLVTVFSSISKILFNLYFSIFGFITSSKRLPTKIQRGQMYIVCCWTVYYCLRFLFLVVFSHATSAEGRRTRRVLSKIDRGAAGRSEMEMFWEHLSGADFEFSACGLFNLNMALITSTFSSGITYLVIMAQLH